MTNQGFDPKNAKVRDDDAAVIDLSSDYRRDSTQIRVNVGNFGSVNLGEFDDGSDVVLARAASNLSRASKADDAAAVNLSNSCGELLSSAERDQLKALIDLAEETKGNKA